MDYKISYTTPRQKVVIADIEAVPMEYVRMKREPKMIEIKKLLDAGETHNWCKLEAGERHLQWRIIKKTNKGD